MSLLFALLAASVTPGCVPAKEPAETREEVVDSFMAAMNRHDTATLGKYIKPGAKIVMGDDSVDLAMMMSALNPNTTLTVLDKKFNQDKTIVVHYRTSPDNEEVSLSFAQDGGCVAGVTQV